MRCPILSELPPPPPDKTGWSWTEESPQLPDTMPDGSPWPRVSIVTPSYNQAQFIEETIRSVLLQGYPNLEYIIIDGGSTDGSVEIIRRYEPWLAYWVSETDRGQSDAINKGIERATGEIVAWINSDDWYLPGVLAERAVHLAEHPNAALVYGDLNYVDEHEEVAAIWRAVPCSTRDLLTSGNDIPQPTVFMRSEALRQVGYLNRELHYIMDWELWVRLSRIGELQVMSGRVANFRRHETSKSVADGYKFMLEHLRWLEEWPHLREVLSEAEIGQAFRYFHLRAAIEYVLAEDEGEAARHFSLAFRDRVWPHGDLDSEAEFVSRARGLNGQAVLGTRAGYATLGRALRKTIPLVMGLRLWRQVASGYDMQQMFRCHEAGHVRELRPHLVRGIWHDPSWLLNRGVWSIGANAFLGTSLAGRLRSLTRRLCPE
jgi:glycosyltransferase involved in cell wall biosynthesis